MHVTMSNSVHHELLTPLKCISGLVAKLKESSLDESKRVDYCNTIVYTSELIHAQIKASLDDGLLSLNVFQPQLGKYALVADVIEPITKLFMSQLEPLKLNLKIENKVCSEIGAVEDPKVRVDKLRIQQILINLLRNSIKFAKRNDTITVMLL